LAATLVRYVTMSSKWFLWIFIFGACQKKLGKSFRALKFAYDKATLTEEILDYFATRDAAEIILSGRVAGCSAPVSTTALTFLKNVDEKLLVLLKKNPVPAEVKERSVLSWASPARRSAFWWYNY